MPPRCFALPPLAHVGTAPSIDAASASRRPPFLGLAVPLHLPRAPRLWIRSVARLHHLSGCTDQFAETEFKGGIGHHLRIPPKCHITEEDPKLRDPTKTEGPQDRSYEIPEGSHHRSPGILKAPPG
ncbi:hypothetical protein C2845_PM15G19140 [Panicum miliaceum]|uniref:Uncharacterized protein n=1 Tax=Panicum miliaceum TaxID=4540 RepID=A0A3L6Q6K2_PANMI|nr:hypothetical protein C2845_PM15G19140 [Panicum miliaceum]